MLQSRATPAQLAAMSFCLAIRADHLQSIDESKVSVKPHGSGHWECEVEDATGTVFQGMADVEVDVEPTRSAVCIMEVLECGRLPICSHSWYNFHDIEGKYAAQS
jgi:hypothetical protein